MCHWRLLGEWWTCEPTCLPTRLGHLPGPVLIYWMVSELPSLLPNPCKWLMWAVRVREEYHWSPATITVICASAQGQFSYGRRYRDSSRWICHKHVYMSTSVKEADCLQIWPLLNEGKAKWIKHTLPITPSYSCKLPFSIQYMHASAQSICTCI